MNYRITIKPAAQKELEKIQRPDRVKIIAAITALGETPRPPGCKKLVNFENHYRIRSGNYRVIYSISDKALIVEVVKVGDRKEVYK